MKNISMKSIQLIKDSYTNYHHSVYLYLYYKIGHKEEAEDLAQDVYVRLMDYDRMLCAETIKYFIFTIARNLVTDYLRRYYKRQEVTSYLYEHAVTYTNETEARVVADDLMQCGEDCQGTTQGKGGRGKHESRGMALPDEGEGRTAAPCFRRIRSRRKRKRTDACQNTRGICTEGGRHHKPGKPAGQCGNVSNICILHISLVYLFTLNFGNVNK